MKLTTKRLTAIGIMAALQFAITIGTAPISFGVIQLRLGTILYFMAFFNPVFIWAGVIGNMVSSIFSPFGPINILASGIAALGATMAMSYIKSMLLASVVSAIAMTATVSTMLIIVLDVPVSLAGITGIALPLLASTLIVMTGIGHSFFRYLQKRHGKIIEIIKNI